MNECGYYDGWTAHTITVTPSFSGFNLLISGRDRNDIKAYIRDTFGQMADSTIQKCTDNEKEEE